MFRPGETWQDSTGRPINAHGGGLLYHEGVYYWYGERRPTGGPELNCQIGVSCYSSTDLLTWTDHGAALEVVHDDPSHPLAAGCKVERPKVIYNAGSGRFVMWWHHDMLGWGHAGALAGLAVADSPVGPFRFVRVEKPNNRMFRDCTVFVDDDGAGYLVFASDDNANLIICRLSDDYEQATDFYHRVFIGRYMEAPCVFKRLGTYYLIASGCTGWWPNEARSASAPTLLGPWKELGNPAVGDGAETTFGAQSTFVLPVVGQEDLFIFMADRWNPQDLSASTYVWLPIAFRDIPGVGTRPFFRWQAAWDLEDLHGSAGRPGSE